MIKKIVTSCFITLSLFLCESIRADIDYTTKEGINLQSLLMKACNCDPAKVRTKNDVSELLHQLSIALCPSMTSLHGNYDAIFGENGYILDRKMRNGETITLSVQNNTIYMQFLTQKKVDKSKVTELAKVIVGATSVN